MNVSLMGVPLNQVPGFQYRPVRFLDTDSKMSNILLAAEPDDSDVIVKICCVEHQSRAELNQQAIVNEAYWLDHFRGELGIAQLRSLPSPSAPTTKWGRLTTRQGKAESGTANDAIQTLPIPGEPQFITLDYLPGGTLTSFVGRNRLRVEMALRIAYYIARTLATLHARQCVHRDLKPENILFSVTPTSQSDIDRFVPTVIDFGVAAQVGTKKMVSGSRLWMAPELQDAYERHGVRIDPSSDVYALGLLLCFMITGRKPRRRSYDYASYEEYSQRAIGVLQADAEDGVLVANVASSVQSDHTVVRDQRLEQTIHLINRTLSKDPSQRPSAQAFAEQVAYLLTLYGRPLPTIDATTKSDYGVQTEAIAPANSCLRISIIALLLAVGIGLAGLVVSQWGFISELGTRSLDASLLRMFSDPLDDELPKTKSGSDESLPPTLVPLAKISGEEEAKPTRVKSEPSTLEPAPTLVPLAVAIAKSENHENAVSLDADTLDTDALNADTPDARNGKLDITLTLEPTIILTDTAVNRENGQALDEVLVQFKWTLAENEVLNEAYCFQLVVWQLNRPEQVVAPLPPIQGAEINVPYALLGNSVNWGVRTVYCTQPDLIVRPALEKGSLPEPD